MIARSEALKSDLSFLIVFVGYSLLYILHAPPLTCYAFLESGFL